MRSWLLVVLTLTRKARYSFLILAFVVRLLMITTHSKVSYLSLDVLDLPICLY